MTPDSQRSYTRDSVFPQQSFPAAHARRQSRTGTPACTPQKRYGDRIFSLLTGITGNRLDAEELTSDVFLKAFTHLDRFRGECRFSTWLYRIAYNTAISHTRRRRPRTVEINDRQYELPDDQEEILFRETQMEYLEQALQRLAPDEKALVELFYLQKIPVHELAAVTGHTEGSIKVKLFRIRKKLAALISNRT